MTQRGKLAALLVALMLPACGGMNPFQNDALVQPKDVTVSQALRDIGEGFSGLRTALDGNILGCTPVRSPYHFR